MNIEEALLEFKQAEKDTERLTALQQVIDFPNSSKKSLALWEIMCLLPSKKERAHLSYELRLGNLPDSTWALVSGLLRDIEQDVGGNAINCFTFSKCRTLGHRLLPFFNASEKPQRTLYCLARYIEETIDRRFGKYIFSNLSFDVSDAILARSFNALFRLGLKDPEAIKVANELLNSHIHATNMDRKAAVSAILYLCFSADKEIIANLSEIRDKVSIPELRRLLNWGLSEINSVGMHDFSKEDAVVFFKKSLFQLEPNFSGYGCFSSKNLLAGLNDFLLEQDEKNLLHLTRTVLALGNQECIDVLAEDRRFGLQTIVDTKNIEVARLWKQYNPVFSSEFCKSVKKIDNYSFWHNGDIELATILFDIEDFCEKKNQKSMNSLWKKILKESPLHALDFLCSQILVLEKDTLEGKSNDKARADFSELIHKRIEELRECFQGKNPEVISEKVFATIINSSLAPQALDGIIGKVDIHQEKWVTLAYSCNTQQLTNKRSFFDSCINYLEIPIQELDCSLENYVEYVCLNLKTLVNIASSEENLFEDQIHKVNAIIHKVQAILDALSDSTEVNGGDFSNSEDDVADWAGHVSVDKPVLRWNAILQCFSLDNLEDGLKKELETTLKESLRVAPHLDKRWIIRGLVRLNTDDAIKSILYQAFQHIDNDFVAHTIRELLYSKHPRAQQALIRCIGRNTIPDELKLNILEDISLENPGEVLRELRALELLKLPQHIDEAIRDAVGRVAAVIDVSSNEELNEKNNPAQIADVEKIINTLLPNADKLSIDTRSAIRTAEMILIQSQSWGTEIVDLSPIVNMHCKAVELALREILEPWTDALMRKGILSRKLDILGYARPIPEKMQLFEDFLASLPIIKTIPYFSRFKLRKMLRAICLYRPGKRFTLDGPKAFALLLLVASRQQCSFGLANLFEVGFEKDTDLFEFIKLVHSLQDSRNRAVHEGLTWEAKDDIESMRNQAYKIIEQALRIGDYLQQQTEPSQLRNLHLENEGT